jgi:hypothetical protein
MSPWRILTFSGFALLAAHTANATTTYYNTNFDPSSLNPDNFDVVMANSFHAATPDFTVVQLLLSADHPADGGTTTVYLAADDGSGSTNNNGVAGSPVLSGKQELGVISDASLSTHAALVTLFLSASNAIVSSTQNQEYWIVLAGNASSVAWYFNVDANQTGVGTGGQAFYFDNGSDPALTITVSDSPNPYAMIVDTPEPGALAILGAGLATLGLVRRRARRSD